MSVGSIAVSCLLNKYQRKVKSAPWSLSSGCDVLFPWIWFGQNIKEPASAFGCEGQKLCVNWQMWQIGPSNSSLPLFIKLSVDIFYFIKSGVNWKVLWNFFSTSRPLSMCGWIIFHKWTLRAKYANKIILCWPQCYHYDLPWSEGRLGFFTCYRSFSLHL